VSKKHKLLILIVLIAAVLRLWNLGNIPSHLRNDEAALGYNAYSVLNSGKDEHGGFFPILFRSFGDWKPGLYVYLTIPFVAILGLNEWSVRLPGAISGILSVYLLYLLVKSLFNSQRVAQASAFSLAISPWHITFSRGAWEAQVTVALIIAGILFFIKALNKNKWYLFLSAGFFGASLLMSHSAKPATPIIFICLLLTYWRKISKIPFKIILLGSLLFILLSLPIIFSFFNDKNTRVTSLLFTNKYQVLSMETLTSDFLKNWTSHYNLPVLFIKGDGNPQHSAADFGAFTPFEIVFLFLGLKSFIKMKDIDLETKLFILTLLILTPLASALTSEGVNFVRYLTFFMVINIILGLGLSNFKRNLFWGIFILFYILSFLLFLDAYFIHNLPKNSAWQNGYKEMVEFITSRQTSFPKVYVPQSGDQPYIFFLFYQKYSPEKFQAISDSVNIVNGSNSGMDYVSKLGNIEFVDFQNFTIPLNQSSLVVLPGNNSYKFEDSLKNIHEIKDPIGFPIYKIGEYIPKKL